MIKETWPISINLWKLVWISLWFSIGLIYKKKKILFFLCIWQLCCFLPQFMLLRKIYFPEVSHPSSSLWHYSSLLPLTTPASWLAMSVRSRMDGSYFGVKHLKYFRGGDFKELCSVSSCIPARALRREVGLKAGKLSWWKYPKSCDNTLITATSWCKGWTEQQQRGEQSSGWVRQHGSAPQQAESLAPHFESPI